MRTPLSPRWRDHFSLVLTAYAVGCILSPLRGQKPLASFHPESAKRDLTHTLKPISFLTLEGAAKSRALSNHLSVISDQRVRARSSASTFTLNSATGSDEAGGMLAICRYFRMHLTQGT